MAAQRESSLEESSEWAGISESGDDDMDFEVGRRVQSSLRRWFLAHVVVLAEEQETRV